MDKNRLVHLVGIRRASPPDAPVRTVLYPYSIDNRYVLPTLSIRRFAPHPPLPLFHTSRK